MSPELAAQCARALHVICPGGEVLRAGRATLLIFKQLGWWWLAPLSLPPLIWLVELGYRIVANNRRFFSRFLFREE